METRDTAHVYDSHAADAADEGDKGNTIEEEKMRKRIYFRERKRLLRIRQKSDREVIEASIRELEARLCELQQRRPHAVTTTSLLSWKDTAVGLQEARNDSIAVHRRLNHRHFLNKSTLDVLKRWVSSWSPSPSLSTTRETWRHSSLVASAGARDVAKEWIAAQMYHNTDAVFSRYMFPTRDHDLHDATFEFDDDDAVAVDGGFHYVRRWQTRVAAPMDVVLDTFRAHFPSICLLDELHPVSTSTVVEATTHTHLHQLVTHHRRQEWVNALAGTFEDGDARAVFVARQIQDDARFDVDDPQRNILFWLDLHRWDATTCHMRFLFVLSHRREKHGYVSMDEEALEGWGCDLRGVPDYLRQSKFRHHANIHAHTLQIEVERRLQTHLAAVQVQRRQEADLDTR
ncbi:Aste57867_8853 [Aphanomyces stellatus]|uniref:Aste57867_8853 protein n=1 Tax=Aphanomyces stellatus TaxID=120398 RepID=A0A485KLA3_9STRA|nr:hypothetical protein As57867_008818 [Aphanomyces stellatus]VFT85739.1 Aste57867_8853 [Aphanomyces stellatus]